jgi:hypothetical protein
VITGFGFPFGINVTIGNTPSLQAKILVSKDKQKLYFNPVSKDILIQ